MSVCARAFVCLCALSQVLFQPNSTFRVDSIREISFEQLTDKFELDRLRELTQEEAQRAARVLIEMTELS